MKKLAVIAATVAFVATTQAASCLWSGLNVGLQDPADVATSYTMYLLDANITSATAMSAALSAGNTSLISGAMVETTSGIAAGTTAARWTKTFGDYATGTTVKYYTVILNDSISNADHYMITAEKSGTAPQTGNLSMAFGTQASNTWQTMSVPEPTSGLMLLLGMAGLALKRKHV